MKVDRTAELQVQSLKQREQGADKVSTARNQEAQATDKVDLATPVRVGQQVIYVSLSKSLSLNGKAFDPSASAKTSELDGKVEPTEDNPLGFDYKTVAKNVLGFVTGYIKLAQSQGKDEKELQDLLGQARKGIDKGFGSARDELKGMSMLSEDLDKGIEKSYTLIQDELQKFEDELFGVEPETGAEAATETTEEAASAVSGSRQTQGLGFSSSSQASLEITTKDGDKVSIRFDDQENWRLQQQNRYSASGRKAVEAYGNKSHGENPSAQRSETGALHSGKSSGASSSSSSSIYYSRTQGFSFSVEGDLDADELKSIGSLIEQVGSLSDTFFGGDLDGALKQAKELSLDDNELVGMSLSLKQSQAAALQQRSEAAKAASATDTADDSSSTAAQGEQTSSSTDLGQFFAPFADYLARLQEMIAQANSLFDQNKQEDLNGWVIGQQQGLQGDALTQANEQFSSFNQRMQQALAAYNG